MVWGGGGGQGGSEPACAAFRVWSRACSDWPALSSLVCVDAKRSRRGLQDPDHRARTDAPNVVSYAYISQLMVAQRLSIR